MKRILMAAATLALGASLATPALAWHGGSFRGHGVSPGRRIFVSARPRAFFSFGVGFPFYGYAGYYGPAPAYYEPYPVVVPPPYYGRVWVPGHYVWEGGARFYISGHWGY